MTLKGAHSCLVADTPEQRVNSFCHCVNFSAIFVGKGRLGPSLGLGLTGFNDNRVRHWVFIKEFGINTVGPIEAIGAARNLHSRRRFSPSILNKLKDGLVKGETQWNGTFLVDVIEHRVGIHGRGLFGV